MANVNQGDRVSVEGEITGFDGSGGHTAKAREGTVIAVQDDRVCVRFEHEPDEWVDARKVTPIDPG